MSYQTNADTYRQNSVLSMSREELVPLMYEHLLIGLRRAEKQIRDRDIEGKAVSIEKALGILYELLGSLDFEAGGEVATHLGSLYAYLIKEVTEASRMLNADKLQPLIEMVASLHEAWEEATTATVRARAGHLAGEA
jgi:flagellar protein FliS